MTYEVRRGDYGGLMAVEEYDRYEQSSWPRDGATPLKGGEVRVRNESTGAEKGQKDARFDLIPWEQIWKVAELYGKGAAKYEERNWEKGYDWSLSFQALHRHLAQFWNGESYDEETKAHHLASVIFHALALMEFEETHPELDNRPVRNVADHS